MTLKNNNFSIFFLGFFPYNSKNKGDRATKMDCRFGFYIEKYIN